MSFPIHALAVLFFFFCVHVITYICDQDTYFSTNKCALNMLLIAFILLYISHLD